MKAKELKEKSAAELNVMLKEASKTLFGMRTNKNVGQVEKTHLFVQLRRDIARIETILSQKQA